MSALAQYLRFHDIAVSGSDRQLGNADTAAMHESLERLGCMISAQDGSGVTEGIDVLCISTAIEESNPDIAAARSRHIPIIHRSDLLAAIISSKKTIAVAGTSGKSTVTAMIFEFLTACGKSPSLISGAPLRRLESEGFIGNAFRGESELLVVEADESDGTLVKYHPEVSVILNVSKDHKSVDELEELFRTVLSHSTWTAVNADDPILATFPASVKFGKTDFADWKTEREELFPTSVKLFRKGVEYDLPLPGEHTLENLRAALCVCEHFGCKQRALTQAVRDFQGVARRFCINRTERGIYVIDDFAHNPAKIKAAVKTARGICKRVVAVYQPHGYGPTRFLKEEYVSTFRELFLPGDTLYLLPIYYAGGTATKDIKADDIVEGLGRVNFRAEVVKDRRDLLTKLDGTTRTGDCVLIMGARDPSLSTLVRMVVELYGGISGMPETNGYW